MKDHSIEQQIVKMNKKSEISSGKTNQLIQTKKKCKKLINFR